MIKTLKELKREYPDKITTSGNNYHIEGFGWFKQKDSIFGLETYWKNDEAEWVRTSFYDLLKDTNRIYRGI